jgi:hypothetical protein
MLVAQQDEFLHSGDPQFSVDVLAMVLHGVLEISN